MELLCIVVVIAIIAGLASWGGGSHGGRNPE